MNDRLDYKSLDERPPEEAIEVITTGKASMSYLQGSWAFRLANQVFGHDGWDYNVIERTVLTDRVYETNYDNTKTNRPYRERKLILDYGILAEIELFVYDENGERLVRKHDVGSGETSGVVMETWRYDLETGEELSHWQSSVAEAKGNAHKEAITDGVKRCLRTFGDLFGLFLYDRKKKASGANVSRPNGTSNGTPKPKKPTVKTDDDGNPMMSDSQKRHIERLKNEAGFGDDMVSTWLNENVEGKPFEKLTVAEATKLIEFIKTD